MNDISFYTSISDQMGSGDVIEFQGYDELGKLIRAKTGFDTNHSGLVIVMQSPYTMIKRRYIHEAMADGVVTDYLSVVLRKYNGIAFWSALDDEYKTEIPAIEGRAFQYIGVPYDFAGLVRQLFGHAAVETEKMFCSEYVYVANGGEGDAPWPGEVIKKLNRWKPRIQII